MPREAATEKVEPAAATARDTLQSASRRQWCRPRPRRARLCPTRQFSVRGDTKIEDEVTRDREMQKGEKGITKNDKMRLVVVGAPRNTMTSEEALPVC